jgi:glycosyltransferase involved in cell wall biosynthesis
MKPRVLLFQTQAEFGGAQEISRGLGASLEARGYDVHHAFIYRKSENYPSAGNVFFASLERPTPLGLLGAFERLRKHISELQPDVVMTFQHYGNIIGAPLAKIAGVKHVVANLNSAIAACPFWLPYADAALGALRVYDVVVSNSAKTSEEFSLLGRVMGDRMILIDHGVEAKRSPHSKTEARSKLSLPVDVQLLGCAGRLHHQKNQAAIINILPRRESLHLALAGHGAEKDALRRQAEALGVADRLHFLGELTSDDVATFLASLDVFVFPSVAESFGLAVAEAAIVGVPVVSNDLPVLREVLSVDGRSSADFVDANDAGALYAAVTALLDDPARAQALTSNARRLEEHHSLERMVGGYQRILTNAGVGSGKDPASDLGTVDFRSHAS